MVGGCKEEQNVNDDSNAAYVDGNMCDPQLFRWGAKKLIIKSNMCAVLGQPVLEQSVRLPERSTTSSTPSSH